MIVRRSLLLAGLALAAACGGNQPEPVTPPPPASTAGATPEVTAPPSAPAAAAASGRKWDDLTHEEKLAVMKTKVLPTMKDAFQKVDAKDFADFTCVTCHGERIKQGNFDMPNPSLPKLNPKNGFAKEKAEHPEVLKFMMETVVPQMASILNEPQWSPQNKSGFGCGNCHTMEQ